MAMPIDMGGQDIQNGGVIFLTEQADAEDDVSAKGQVWVDNTTPQRLMFTDEDGTDTNLLTAASGVTFPVTPTIKDHSTTWTNNVAIDLALTTAHIQKITLDANLIWATPSNPPASGTQIEFEIEYIQDATGGWTVTQWSEVVETVVISKVASAVTIVTYRTNDGGSNYHAVPSLRGSINLSAVDAANKTLSNLGTTAVNADIIMGSNDVTGIGTLIFTNGNFGGGAAVSYISSDTSGDLVFNVADADEFQLSFQNSLVWAINKSRQLGNAIILTDSLTLNDAAADPAVAGEIQRDGDDVKVFTGGVVKNFTNMVTLSDTNTWTGINTFTNTLNANADTNIGDATTDTLTVTASVDSDFIPTPTANRNLGSGDFAWASIFTSNLRFNASTMFINGAAAGMTFEVPTGDHFNFEINNVNVVTVDGTTFDIHGTQFDNVSEVIFDTVSTQRFTSSTGGLTYDVPTGDEHAFRVNTAIIGSWDNTGLIFEDTMRVWPADASDFIGFYTEFNVGTTLGENGTIQIPWLNEALPAGKANINTDFGNAVGAIGIYMDTIGNATTLVVRQSDGNWSTQVMTHNGVT